MLLIETMVTFGCLVLWRAPETAIGRWLHCQIVARIAARLDRVTRGQMLVALLVAAMFLGAIWLGRDAPRILALASPDLLLLLGSVETSLYIDAALTAALTWSIGRSGIAAATIEILRRRSGYKRAGRTPRTRRMRRPRGGANDDYDGISSMAA